MSTNNVIFFWNKIVVPENEEKENDPMVGNWGGTCACPDGHSYQVGDNNDNCMSLACTGGQMVNCNRRYGKWSKRSVKCADRGKDTLILFHYCSNMDA